MSATKYMVTSSDGRVVGLVDTQAEAEAIVEMHKSSTNDGKAMRSGRENASFAAKLAYKITVAK